MESSFRYKDYHSYSILARESDGYVNFAKLIEVVDNMRIERQGTGKTPKQVTLSQWKETENGGATLRAFARAHPEAKSHYQARKGVPRAFAGVYIHPNLVLPIILWRDHFAVFYFANILKITNDYFHGVIPQESLGNELNLVTKPSKMVSFKLEDEKPQSLVDDETKLKSILKKKDVPADVSGPGTGQANLTSSGTNRSGSIGSAKFPRSRSAIRMHHKHPKARSKSVGGGRANTSSAPGSGSTSVPETEIHSLLVNLLQKPFIKTKPKWLKNDKTGHVMELDMYNDELKLAVEYNGEQHYRIVSPFVKTAEDLQNIRERDILKAKLCQENGVRLITIPYTVPCREFADYLTKILETLGLISKSTL